MAALYGRLKGDTRKDVTRVGHNRIASKLETWHGSVMTELDADGTFRVYTGDKNKPTEVVAEGKVDA